VRGSEAEHLVRDLLLDEKALADLNIALERLEIRPAAAELDLFSGEAKEVVARSPTMAQAVRRDAKMRHAKGGERFRERGPELLCGEREHVSGALGAAKSDILKEECPHIVWAEADADSCESQRLCRASLTHAFIQHSAQSVKTR
jgi:hypothetical protein